jgi:hypothetical protein
MGSLQCDYFAMKYNPTASSVILNKTPRHQALKSPAALKNAEARTSALS